MKGDYLAPTVLETRSHRTTCARHFAHSQKWKKHKLCLCFPYTYTTSTRKDDKPTVCYRQQWNPCHMDFGLVFQQAIDRQDRTLQSRRTLQLYWNHWRHNLNRNLPLPDKDSLHYNDMPCWLHSIEATSCNRNDETISQPTSQDSFASRTP